MEDDQKPKFKTEALHAIIHGHYLEGSTPEKSHERLLKMTLVEAMTLEEVKERFEVAAAGQWSLIEGDPPPSPLNLLSLFALDVISDKILQEFNLNERLILRKVCRTLRDLVFRTPHTLQKLDIQAQGDAMHIISDNFEVKYTDLKEVIKPDYIIQHGGKFKFVSGLLMHHLVDDAKSIMYRKRLTIDELTTTLLLRHYFQDTEPIFNDSLRLKVRKLSLMAECATDIRYTLSILDCNYIEEIWITAGKEVILEEIQMVSHWKLQWKKAKVLISEVAFETNHQFVKDFGHFDYLVYIFGDNYRSSRKQCISLSELVLLKNTLLLRQSVQKIEIIPTEDHDRNDPIFLTFPNCFKPFQDPEDSKRFIFPYPDSTEVLTFEIAFNGIVFTGPGFKNSKIEFNSSGLKKRRVHIF